MVPIGNFSVYPLKELGMPEIKLKSVKSYVKEPGVVGSDIEFEMIVELPNGKNICSSISSSAYLEFLKILDKEDQ